MDRLYADIFQDIYKSCDLTILSQLILVDKYILTVAARYIRRAKIKEKMSAYKLLYLKKYRYKYVIKIGDCIKANSVETIKWIRDFGLKYYNIDCCSRLRPETISDIDTADVMKLLLEMREDSYIFSVNPIKYIVRYTSVDEFIELAENSGYEYNYHEILCEAIEWKHVDLFTELYNNQPKNAYNGNFLIGIDFHTGLFELAVKNQEIDIMKQIYDKTEWIGKRRTYLDCIVKDGNVDMLKQFHNYKNVEYNEFSITIAAKAGNLDNIKWLFANGYKVPSTAVKDAIREGNYDVAKWLIENSDNYKNQDTFDAAVYSENLEIVKLLQHNWSGWNKLINNYVIVQPTIIKWLLDNGYTCDRETFKEACKACNIETLKILYEYGCPVIDVKIGSNWYNNPNNVEWLRSIGCQ